MTKKNERRQHENARKGRGRRDDPAQSRRFMKAAKEAEADQDDASAADSIMERMAKKPPKEHKNEKPGQ